ncbi:MAG: ABC transporter substrate-binding protein [bacterium]|nr:ABC transporter substrate-binding protein [bacterium]MDE0242950.1 ABC transporter substrate-binding protein [bacterium]MDE0416707.1 ABC transporter substrate-binding protein [bacterium]
MSVLSKGSSRRAFMGTALAAPAAAALTPAQLLAQANDGMEATGEPIPVGQASAQTSWGAPDGIEFMRGLTLACEEINAIGGILGRPLEPHIEDTGEMGDDRNVQAVQRLIDRHDVHAIVNGYNVGTGIAIQDVIADAGIIYMHYDTVIAHNELVASDPDYYFGSFMGDPPEYWYGAGFLDYINTLEKNGEFTRSNNRIAIITGPGPYSTNIANSIREGSGDYGYEVSLFESVTVPISEWGPTLAKIRQDPPAVIAITHFYPQDLAQFMLQFVPDPTPSLIYMQYGPSLAAFRDIGKESTNGVLYATVIAALPDEIGSAFERRYKDRWGEDATHLTGSQPYDGCYIWATACALAGGSGAPGDEEQNRKVAAHIRRMIHRGMNGTTRFIPGEQAAYHYPAQTNDPSLGMPHQFLQIQDHMQTPVLVAPQPYSAAPFVTPPWMS